MKILACGGRNYADLGFITATLGEFDPKVSILIHGAARGADRLASHAAHELGWLDILPFPADWARHGRRAGPVRNTQMLIEGKPDLVVAFPGGVGTADMVSQAEKAGVPVTDLRQT